MSNIILDILNIKHNKNISTVVHFKKLIAHSTKINSLTCMCRGNLRQLDEDSAAALLLLQQQQTAGYQLDLQT
jgi:hypothetical protein